LQAILIRPFLNEKAESILGKLSAEILGDNTRLKVALLQEFKLSANVYLERFNTCRKDTDETYVAFASRLKGLLDYYFESRRVDNFEKLCELLICDRVKYVLPQGCLRYVLSIASSKDPSWLDLRALTEAIDAASVVRLPACRTLQHMVQVTRREPLLWARRTRNPVVCLSHCLSRYRREPQSAQLVRGGVAVM